VSKQNPILTDRTRAILRIAQDSSRAAGHRLIHSEDLLRALVVESTGIAARMLVDAGVAEQLLQGSSFRERLWPDKQQISWRTTVDVDSSLFDTHMFDIWKTSVSIARKCHRLGAQIDTHRMSLPVYVGTEHILLGIIEKPNSEAGRVLARSLESVALTLANVRDETISWLGLSSIWE
jgi:ATP-dependent Clp protease ATP-binding subunit ClpA